MRRESPNFIEPIRQEIMQDLMDEFYNTIDEKQNLFLHNPEILAELTLSVCLMFSRELIVHLIQMSNLEHKRKEIMRDFCEGLKAEVNYKIKKSMV